MKAVLKSILVTILFMVMALQMMAQDKNKSHMLGFLGGVAFTSNPPALQKLTEKSHYVDGNGGISYLYHNNVSDGYAFEWQLSFIGSSVKTLESADNETKVKFIMPLDFRWFLGNYQKIQAYVGLGLQYNTVWLLLLVRIMIRPIMTLGGVFIITKRLMVRVNLIGRLIN